MSQIFETLQDRYRDLVAQSLADATDEAFLERARVFLSDTRQAGAVVTGPEERSLLRAYMRFLATLLYRAGHDVPEVGLLPPDRERWPTRPPASQPGPAVPAWVWGLAGGAALVVLAGLVAVAGVSLGALPFHSTPTPPPPTSTAPSPTPTPTPTLVPTFSPEPTAIPPPPSFNGLTTCLGVLSPTAPFRAGEDFDWHTQAVYAVFDYSGMRDGLAWSAVWIRDGEEVAREEDAWDLERGGSEGTLWVAHFNPEGTFMWAGAYTVSLYIEDALQAEASFRVRRYEPGAP
jgi:hypothetical protein